MAELSTVVEAAERAQESRQNKAAWGAMLAGTALSVYGWTRKSASGAAIGIAGGAIALKAASAGPIADLIGTESTTIHSVFIMRSPAEIYAFWKDLRNAQLWMEQIESVTPIDGRTARWTRRNGDRRAVESTIQITEEIPNAFIAWRALQGAESEWGITGRIEFREVENRGTMVNLTVCCKMRPGLLHSGTATVAGGHSRHEMRENLRRFKMLLEAGEIATIEGQSHGPRTFKGKLKETLEQAAVVPAF